MKSLFLSLLLVLLFALSTLAADRHPRRSGRHFWGMADTEQGTPGASEPELLARAAQASAYYTDVLRLSHAQAQAVRHATLRLLKEQAQDTTQTGQAARYNRTMLRLLRPSQYSTFRVLADYEPGEVNQPVAIR